MPAQSKEQLSDEEKKEFTMRRINLVLRHMFLNLVVLVAPFQSRTQYILKLAGGDAAKCGAWTAYMSAAAGLVEFFLNPVLGRLSDKVGRKVFLMLSPFVNFVLKLAVALTDGNSLTLVALERVLAGAITTVGGSTTCAAAISDMVKGPELAGHMGNLGSYAGMGVLFGPFISGQLLNLTGQVKHTYMFGAFVALLQLIYNGTMFEETLEKSKPMDWSACNPFSFIKIFTGDVTVAKLALVAGLQCFPEGKSIADMNMIYVTNNIKMSQQMQTWFVMLFGCSMIVAGKLPKMLIHTKTQQKYLTPRNFTSASNWLTVLAMINWGAFQNVYTYMLGLGLLCPTMERRAASSAMCTDLAVANGFGKGEFAGYFANWRALCVAAAPLLYGETYRAFEKTAPGAAYFSAAAIVAATECVFRAIPEDALVPQEDNAEAEAKAIFAAVDKNKDGKLTRAEINKYFRNNPKELQDRFMRGKTFKAFWQDLDNYHTDDDTRTWTESEWCGWYMSTFAK